jgi:hypothetical protein
VENRASQDGLPQRSEKASAFFASSRKIAAGLAKMILDGFESQIGCDFVNGRLIYWIWFIGKERFNG